MPLPPVLSGLRLPVIGAPMFLVSGPELVVAQCKAGIVGSFPALNAREADGRPIELETWLERIRGELADHEALHPARPAAPFAVNLIVHRSNTRLERDLALLVRHRVPIWITSLGARPEVNAAAREAGAIVLHDVIDDRFARKAIEKGADGLIAVAAGAGGHAGTWSPFALVQEIRSWFDGPLVLSGAIATGGAILAARAIGADLAYVGSAFVATEEANADPAYKQMIVEHGAADIVYTPYFSGVAGNYLAPSIKAQGHDPAALPERRTTGVDFGTGGESGKAWRDVWSAGQGIGAVRDVVPAGVLVDRLADAYRTARRRLGEEEDKEGFRGLLAP